MRPELKADLWQFIWRLDAHLLLYEHYCGDHVTGITCDSLMTGHDWEEVGQQPQQQMVGKSFAATKNEKEG